MQTVKVKRRASFVNGKLVMWRQHAAQPKAKAVYLAHSRLAVKHLNKHGPA